MKLPAQTSSLRIFKALLVMYPRQFREAYGREMVQTFRDLLREEPPESAAQFARLWRHLLWDMAFSAIRERSEEMQGRGFLLMGAAALGMAIAWVDARPNWDDTGITAGALFLSCAILGAVSPKQPWQWALAVGLWIPLTALLWTHNYGAVIALVPAFLGAYLGAGIRSLAFPPPSQA
jgi:hypothetical protein